MSNSTDVVIHISNALDSKHRGLLSDHVKKISGVVSASLHDKRPHLMIVAYNSNEIKAQDVLSNVQDNGLQAQLVGWL